MLRVGIRRGSDRLDAADAERRVRLVFPTAHVAWIDPVADTPGRRSWRLAVTGAPSPLLLREYRSDPAECVREAAVLRALPAVVPVAQVHHVAPDDDPAWSLHSWLGDGPLSAALRIYWPEATLMLANDLGALLSAVHRVEAPAGCPALPIWSEAMLALLDAAPIRRLGDATYRSLREFTLANASTIDALYGHSTLCHGNLTPARVMVYASGGMDDRKKLAGWVQWDAPPTLDRPRLAGIADWASAAGGPPLFDVGTLLRNDDRLPAGFCDEFAAGYARWDTPLSADWRTLARSLDLVNLCGLVERAEGGRLARIHALIEATVRPESRAGGDGT